MDAAPPPPSAWSPLRIRLFRTLWIATVASNLGTWLQSVGAAWLMTSLSTSPTLVALVQAATSGPMFLLSLPAGALADVLDRRRLLLLAQSWMLAAAAGLGLLTLTGAIGPASLLLFTFALGLGAALNQPAWQAIIPELVPREELGRAVALGSVGFNIARSAGPALGGLLVAAAGPAANFLLNAVSFLGVIVVLYRWRPPEMESVLPAERVLGAMRTGLRYVRHAPAVRAVIVRGGTFVLCASALWALLPVVTRQRLGAGPAGYGLLLAALGIGAVLGAFALPRLRRGSSARPLALVATVVFAGAVLVLAWVQVFWLVALALLAAGGAWLTLLSTLNVAVQTQVPSWVRARAISVYMLAFFGGLAGGSALWGALAQRFGLAPALTGAAAGLLAGLALVGRLPLPAGEAALDLSPSRQWPAPIVRPTLEPERGPVLVTVRFHIDPARRDEFRRLMAQRRRIRLRDGALEWGLFVDSAEEGRYTEVFLVRSWLEHLRQHERLTIDDSEVDRRVHALHREPGPPPVEHLIAERVPRPVD